MHLLTDLYPGHIRIHLLKEFGQPFSFPIRNRISPFLPFVVLSSIVRRLKMGLKGCRVILMRTLPKPDRKASPMMLSFINERHLYENFVCF